ncbi:helix-turn-helix transcriptional regulator [Candidatus Bathyarchaeota archaeon]|nr:MAG: helix-turn-helix transcriptional regulator [Candidatus Bathyarchaeota archaeon]
MDRLKNLERPFQDMEARLDQLDTRFRRFGDVAAKFSEEIIETVSGTTVEGEASKTADINVEIAKAIFGKWSIEILAILYHIGAVGFEELRRRLGAISPRVLSTKLKVMELQGLVERSVRTSRPIGVRYSLTEEGLTVAKIGEPIFLYLRFCLG